MIALVQLEYGVDSMFGKVLFDGSCVILHGLEDFIIGARFSVAERKVDGSRQLCRVVLRDVFLEIGEPHRAGAGGDCREQIAFCNGV